MFSGGQISLLELVSRLDRPRYEPVLLCPGEGQLAYVARGMGVKVLVWEMPGVRRFNIPLIHKKIAELRSIIKDTGADIVHTNGSRAQFYASEAVKGTGARLVWHVRESVKDIPFYDRFLARSADRIICVSKAVSETRFGSSSVNDGRIKVIYNGIDLSRYYRNEEEGLAVRGELEIGNDDVLLGAIGLLIPRKGYEFLFRAVSLVTEKRPGIKLLVAGKTVDGDYMAGLRKMVQESGLAGNVIFTSPRDDVRAVLSAADIFVLSSKSEGFSRVLIEAMACSCPVIATDVAGNNEAVVDGESGVLVPYGNDALLAKAIGSLVSDPERAARLGGNARRRVEENFSIGKSVEEVQRLYEGLGRT